VQFRFTTRLGNDTTFWVLGASQRARDLSVRDGVWTPGNEASA
jgi:hypothetical protein